MCKLSVKHYSLFFRWCMLPEKLEKSKSHFPLVRFVTNEESGSETNAKSELTYLGNLCKLSKKSLKRLGNRNLVFHSSVLWPRKIQVVKQTRNLNSPTSITFVNFQKIPENRNLVFHWSVLWPMEFRVVKLTRDSDSPTSKTLGRSSLKFCLSVFLTPHKWTNKL